MKPTKHKFLIIPCKESKAKSKLSQTRKFLQSQLQEDLQPSSQLKEISSSLNELNKTNWKANIGELAKKLKSMPPPSPKPTQNDSSNDSETKESNSTQTTTMPNVQRKRQKILEALQNSKKPKPSIIGNAQTNILKYSRYEIRVRQRYRTLVCFLRGRVSLLKFKILSI